VNIEFEIIDWSQIPTKAEKFTNFM